MATFRINDKVRIVRADAAPYMVGKEAVVRGFLPAHSEGSWWVMSAYEVEVAGAPSSRANGCWLAESHNIVPVRRDDNEVGEWSEMGWHPSDFLREVEA